MNKKQFFLTFLLMVFSFCSLWGQATTSKHHVEKPGTGYYKIDLKPAFNVKVNMVSFNHNNSGTKKVAKGSQVLGVQFAVWNFGKKMIKVSRSRFKINKQEINHFLVLEKETQPLVVKIPAGKAVGLINYYIMDDKIQTLVELKVEYFGVTKSYKPVRKIIPIISKKK